jgi:hypothetical protein
MNQTRERKRQAREMPVILVNELVMHVVNDKRVCGIESVTGEVEVAVMLLMLVCMVLDRDPAVQSEANAATGVHFSAQLLWTRQHTDRLDRTVSIETPRKHEIHA